MKKTLLFVVLLAFGSSLSAQITHSGILDQVLVLDDSVEFDINADGIMDFTFVVDSMKIDTVTVKGGYLVPVGPNRVISNVYQVGAPPTLYDVICPDTLMLGDAINASGAFEDDYTSAAGYHMALGITGEINITVPVPFTIPIAVGDYLDKSGFYLGVEVDIAGQKHYGWILVSLNADGTQLTIHEYAMEGTANQEIIAGDRGSSTFVSVKESVKEEAVFFLYGNQIHLKNIEQGSNVSLISLTGKKVLTVDLSSGNSKVSVPELAEGLYLLVLDANKGNQQTKKVLIR